MKKEVPSFAVSRLHRRPVLLAAVRDQGPIWVTGSEVGSSGPDIVGRNGCYSVKKVTTSSIGALDGPPLLTNKPPGTPRATGHFLIRVFPPAELKDTFLLRCVNVNRVLEPEILILSEWSWLHK